MKGKYLCLALLVVWASCNRSQPSAQGPAQVVVSPHTDTNSPRGKAALAFAHALTDGDFAAAHNQLSASLKSSLSEESLKKNYEEMIAAYDSPPSLVDLTTTMDVWPGRQQSDIGWAYIQSPEKIGLRLLPSSLQRKMAHLLFGALNGVGHELRPIRDVSLRST